MLLAVGEESKGIETPRLSKINLESKNFQRMLNRSSRGSSQGSEVKLSKNYNFRLESKAPNEMFSNELMAELPPSVNRRKMLPPRKKKGKMSFYTRVFEEKPTRMKLNISTEGPVGNESREEAVCLHRTRDGQYQGVLTRTIDLGGKSESEEDGTDLKEEEPVVKMSKFDIDGFGDGLLRNSASSIPKTKAKRNLKVLNMTKSYNFDADNNSISKPQHRVHGHLRLS